MNQSRLSVDGAALVYASGDADRSASPRTSATPRCDSKDLALDDAPLCDGDYRTLAGFRRELRRFLGFSEKAAQRAGVTSQQYQALLAIRAAPGGRLAIGAFAEQMLLRPHSATGLLDRLELAGMVERVRQTDDRRKVEIGLTPHGALLLGSLAAAHREELRRLRPLLKGLVSRFR